MKGSTHEPSLFGPYRPVRRLADGGMGETWLVKRVTDIPDSNTNAQLERLFVAKRIRADWVNRADARLRFTEEIRQQSMVYSDFIVPVFDIGESDNQLYAVMEWVDGCNLLELMDAYSDGQPEPSSDEPLDPLRTIPVPVVAKIAYDIASALEVMHEQQNGRCMVHRDVKPANIVLSCALNAKLTDFGLVHAEDRPFKTSFHVDSPAGSLSWMAPEQYLQGSPDPRWDMYSLGVVIYQMLTRTLPISFPDEAGGARDLVSENPQIRERAMRRLRTMRPDLLDPGHELADVDDEDDELVYASHESHAGLVDIVGRLLARDMQHRYQSAHELRRDLASIPWSALHTMHAEMQVRHARYEREERSQEEHGTGSPCPSTVVRAPQKDVQSTPRRRGVAMAAAAACLTGLVVLGWVFANRTDVPPTPVAAASAREPDPATEVAPLPAPAPAQSPSPMLTQVVHASVGSSETAAPLKAREPSLVESAASDGPPAPRSERRKSERKVEATQKEAPPAPATPQRITVELSCKKITNWAFVFFRGKSIGFTSARYSERIVRLPVGKLRLGLSITENAPTAYVTIRLRPSDANKPLDLDCSVLAR